MRALSLAALCLAGALALAACDAGSTVSEDRSVVGLVGDEEEFSTLDAVLADVGLQARLAQGGPYTLFAPTDVAFQALGAPTLAALRSPANRDLLTKVIEAHVVPGEVRPEDLRDGDRLPTLQGTELEVRVVEGRVTVAGVDVRRVGMATDGFVYAVNALFRDHLTAAERIRVSGLLSTLRQTLEAAGRLDELDGPGPFTLFVPIDDAFDALGPGAVDRLLGNASLLERLVTNHVVAGRFEREDLAGGEVLTSEAGAPLRITTPDGGLEVEGVEVLLADVAVSNGVLHLVSGVLTSNLTVTEAATLAGVDLWAEAVARAGLGATLEGAGPFTVFAPTNGAFGSAADLAFYAEEGLLSRIARVHVVPGRFMADDLRGVSRLPTLEGAEVRVAQTADGDARVGRSALFALLRTDIVASNGVLHVIEAVIDPPVNLFEAVVFERRKRFVEGLRLTGLDATLAEGGPFTVFAPTEEAWSRVNPAQLASLFSPPNRNRLEAVLGYHIGEGGYAPDALPGALQTLEGSMLPVSSTSAGIFVGPDGARAVGSFVVPENGALYQVEAVLFPPEE